MVKQREIEKEDIFIKNIMKKAQRIALLAYCRALIYQTTFFLFRLRAIFFIQVLAGMDILEAVERRGSFSSHLHSLYGGTG